MVRRTRRAGQDAPPEELVARVREESLPLGGPESLDPLLDRIGDARFVLLGEASHGTSEYYSWRVEISKQLIREKGFSFIAVEGDWPSCDDVDRSIRGSDFAGASTPEVLQSFHRWPTWMWANEEIVGLVDWLRTENKSRPDREKVGFHGLDVYSLWDSLYSILGYLRRVDPKALDAARKAFRCFDPYGEDAQEYARATARFLPESCEDEVIRLLSEIRRKAPAYRQDDPESAFRAEQNALVVQGAEAYYRAMVRGGPESWNIRDRHMADTLGRLSRHYGPDSKAIVWEHNTHIGDARFTDMADDGTVNVGQLARERFGDEGVVLVGFSTHRGTVIAGEAWDAPHEVMTVPEAVEGSWDDVLHRACGGDRLILMDRLDETPAMLSPRGQRAIGVVYHPEYEAFGNYVPTVLPRRYDAVLHVDETHALHPLPVRAEPEEMPETFPSGR